MHLGDARSSPVPSVVAYGDTRWEGKECGGRGGARRRVPDIAGEVGSGGGDLGAPRRILSSTHRRARHEPNSSLWYNLECPPYFRRGKAPAREGTPEPTRGWWW